MHRYKDNNMMMMTNGKPLNLLNKYDSYYDKAFASSFDIPPMDKSKNSILSQRTSAALAIVTIFIVLYKTIILYTGKSISLLVTDTSMQVLTQIKLSSYWLSSNFGFILWPMLCGLMVTFFTWTMLYFDSDIPGVSPPSPMTSPQKTRYRLHRERTCHLSYLIAIASGCVVFALLYF